MSFEENKNSPVEIRFKRVLIVGIIIGCIAGGVVTLILSSLFLATKEGRKRATVSSAEGQQVEKTENSNSLAEEKLQVEEQLKNEKTLHEEMNDPASLLASDKDNWNLALVNSVHPLAQSYVPKMKELVPGKKVDERIYDEAKKMLDEAKKAGISVVVCSAYRSYDDQKMVFQDTMKQWMGNRKDLMDAFYITNKSVALPGQSEHATGLALDITSADYTELDEGQASTDAAKWLQKHCAEYGFILRYPPEKSDITKIIYEPWHYRYVGKEKAAEIMSEGITLEEYWEKQFQ